MTKAKSKSKAKSTAASKGLKIEKNHPIEKNLKKLSKQVEALEKAVAELKEKQISRLDYLRYEINKEKNI